MSNFFRAGATKSPLRRTFIIGATAGFAVSAIVPPALSLWKQYRVPIRNDSPATTTQSLFPTVSVLNVDSGALNGNNGTETTAATNGSKGGLQRVLVYEQLTLGSMTGALAGYVLGKLSKALVVLFISGYLASQFLYSRGIEIPGLTASHLSQVVVAWGREKMSLKELVMNQPSFKVSFVTAFLVAAAYA